MNFVAAILETTFRINYLHIGICMLIVPTTLAGLIGSHQNMQKAEPDALLLSGLLEEMRQEKLPPDTAETAETSNADENIEEKQYQEPSSVKACPKFFVPHGSSCYGFFDDPILPWWDAMSFCALFADGNGSLAVINGDKEQIYIESVLRSKTWASTFFWLGATDLLNEGTWIWIKSDKQVGYTKWGPGEPNGGRRENCLMLHSPLNWNWNDESCRTTGPFICEVSWKKSDPAVDE